MRMILVPALPPSYRVKVMIKGINLKIHCELQDFPKMLKMFMDLGKTTTTKSCVALQNCCVLFIGLAVFYVCWVGNTLFQI